MGWFGSAGAWFRPTDSVEQTEGEATVSLSVGARAVKLDAGVMFYPSYAGIGGGPALIIPYDERPVSIGVDLEVVSLVRMLVWVYSGTAPRPAHLARQDPR